MQVTQTIEDNKEYQWTLHEEKRFLERQLHRAPNKKAFIDKYLNAYPIVTGKQIGRAHV